MGNKQKTNLTKHFRDLFIDGFPQFTITFYCIHYNNVQQNSYNSRGIFTKQKHEIKRS